MQPGYLRLLGVGGSGGMSMWEGQGQGGKGSVKADVLLRKSMVEDCQSGMH